MADRTVKVTLKANVADFNQQIKNSSKTLEELVKKADKTGTVADTGLGRLTQRAQLMGGELQTVGATAAAFGAGLLALSGAAIKTSADFDAAMSVVQANTMASGREMTALRDLAIEAGAATVFSASEAAQGIDELAKAGVSTADILGGGLKGALDLAAAGGIGVGEAAETAATAMSQFNLSGSDVSHVADLLAAGAGKAQGGVHDLAAALKQGGLVAAQMGLSIEETVGGLAAFASAGLLGSDAGTSFKTMLQRLAAPSKESATLMQELGINAYDAQGEFVGLANFAGQLQSALGDMSAEQRNAALSTMFGSDAIRAASVLYSQGAAGIQEWINNVNQSGYASEVAAARMDNLQGDLEALGGSVETLMIRLGESSQGPLRLLVQGADAVVDALSKLPAPVLAVGQGLTIAAGGFLTVAGGAMLVLPRIVETKAAIEALGLSSMKSARLVSALATAMRSMSLASKGLAGLALAGIVAGISGAMKDLSMTTEEAAQRIEGLTKAGKSLDTAFNFDIAKRSAGELQAALDDIANPSNMDRIVGAWDGFAERIAKGVSFGHWDVRTDFRKMRNDLEDLGNALAGMDLEQGVEGFRKIAEVTDGSQASLTNLLNSMPGFKEHLRGMAEEAGIAATDANLLAIAMGELDPAAVGAGQATNAAKDGMEGVGEAAETTADKLEKVINALAELYGVTLNHHAAERALEAAIDDATDAADRYGETLDRTTAEGRANEAALEDIADKALQLMKAMQKAGKGSDEMSARMQVARDSFIATAIAMGMEADEAAAYADSLGLIPEKVSTVIEQIVEADTAEAEEKIKGLEVKLDGQKKTIQIGASTFAAQTSLADIIAQVARTEGTVTINGETKAASDALMEFLGITAQENGTVKIDADPSGAEYKLEELRIQMGPDGKPYVVKVDANVQEAVGNVARMQAGINESKALMRVDAETTVAQQSVATLNQAVSSQWANVNVGANDSQARSTVSGLNAHVQSQNPPIQVGAQDSPARAAVGTLNAYVLSQKPRINVGAVDNASGVVRGIVAGLPRVHTIMVNVVKSAASALGLATGGPVHGPGTSTSDSIPARLSNGEHVWTAAEVKAMGGHDRVFKLRALARAGMLDKHVLGFADGGTPAMVSARPPSVHVTGGTPRAEVTVVVENPVSGETLTKHIETVADGRIVRANKMN